MTDFSNRSVDAAEAADKETLRNLTTNDEIVQFLRDRWDDTTLDDLVHDAKSEEATEINNDGLDAQVEYLADDSPVEFARALADRLYG